MSKKANKGKKTLAQQADRHHLYELSVQYAASEIEFVDDTYKKLRGRHATLLREDFCGTANVCCEWVWQRKSNRAIGVDIDAEVLGWGRDNRVSKLSSGQKKRLQLLENNVLKAKTESPDVISAMNFSYWLFKQRKQLKSYFSKVREALIDDGVFFMDAYGGYDAFREIEEEREIDDGAFTYIWEQEKYEPISGGLICHIHFVFPDGSKLKRAFSYDWRLWTLPEIRELLEEVGFRNITFYWQGWDQDGEPDGIFEPADEGEADAGWICYITAEK
ncbi:class I SAM-dependent methyltransferase [Candidatus Vondammii sp. HM_W22]|uniref:class I SAM-dependent methyltransferase n=1 Tax=Candidatus Vondammii sp. HM_W22 TaxID=2687299 RepID=UPI002A4E22B8|nr:class I SAM-dependent methyltransferase [Candidatus Vondammii sp. HM_W22]